MHEKIRGIVLRSLKYGDKGLIVDLFTESHGRRSFMTSVSRGKTTTGLIWAPLNMVEFEADLHATKKLPRPKDVYIYNVYRNMRFSPLKSSLSMFLADFLNSALREEEQNVPLYIYIETSLRWLDEAEEKYRSNSLANFHLVFLMRLTRFLGIYPNVDDYSDYSFFDMCSSCFCVSKPYHPHFLSPSEASFLPKLLRMNYDTMHLFRFSRAQRQYMLEMFNVYYRIHLPSFPELKSLQVLRELFD